MANPRPAVLIVGAGLAGLTAATLLAWRGIPCRLVERRASTSRHPRARGINLRSLELLHPIPGLADELCGASAIDFATFTIVIAESVAGREIRTVLAPGQMDTTALSPSGLCAAGQDRVEPILLRYARALGAEIRFATELVAFTQDGDGVGVTLRDLTTGEETSLATDYLIAADGARSRVRQSLGIGVQGRGTLSHNMSILFAADLTPLRRGHRFALYYLQNPEFTGVFIGTDDPRVGQVSVEYNPARESPADYDAARCRRIVRAALGVPDLEVDVLDVMPWEMSARVADRLMSGRVFLAGDAAHTMPPTGGLGGQTAIQDDADLAWKLAMVVQGQAGPALLETYQAERHPVAALTVARQTANYVDRLRPDRTDLADPDVEVDYLSVAMGYRYRSAAIIADAPHVEAPGAGLLDNRLPDAGLLDDGLLDDGLLDDGRKTENPLHPTGRPGTRLAHVPMLHAGRNVSTLDLIERDFVLFAAPGGGHWADAAPQVAARLGVGLMSYRLGVDLIDPGGTFMMRTGLASGGALLVRPDGFIAWRPRGGDVADPTATLAEILGRVLCRPAVARDRAA